MIRTIPKPGPAKSNVVLWTDESANVFYSWGGRHPHGRNITRTNTPELWRFAADGHGGGSWSKVDTDTSGLLGSEEGAWVSTPTTGFLIGGMSHHYVNYWINGRAQPVPGMLAFDFKTATLTNGTGGFSPFGTTGHIYGFAEYVPVYGPNGIIMLFGGYATDPVGVANFEESYGDPLRLDNLIFFDPVTKKTYRQKATGDIPETPRSDACVVGFANSDGGFDM